MCDNPWKWAGEACCQWCVFTAATEEGQEHIYLDTSSYLYFQLCSLHIAQVNSSPWPVVCCVFHHICDLLCSTTFEEKLDLLVPAECLVLVSRSTPLLWKSPVLATIIVPQWNGMKISLINIAVEPGVNLCGYRMKITYFRLNSAVVPNLPLFARICISLRHKLNSAEPRDLLQGSK